MCYLDVDSCHDNYEKNIFVQCNSYIVMSLVVLPSLVQQRLVFAKTLIFLQFLQIWEAQFILTHPHPLRKSCFSPVGTCLKQTASQKTILIIKKTINFNYAIVTHNLQCFCVKQNKISAINPVRTLKYLYLKWFPSNGYHGNTLITLRQISLQHFT